MNVFSADWIILILIFAAFLWLAIYLNAQVKSVSDYLVSARKVRVFLGMGAGIAGEIGLVSIVAICQQGYLRGFAFVLIGVMTKIILLPLFGVFGFGIERFRATKAMSVPQYIEMRYSRRLRIITGFTNSLAGVAQMLIFPIVGAEFVRVLIKAPETFTLSGLELQTTWVIMLILLSCAIIFALLGGYITLVVGNFFQMIIIMGVVYWLFGTLIKDVGIQNFWTNLEQTKGLSGVYPFTGDENSYGFEYFLWVILMSILLNFSYGPYLQKYASMDKPRTVRLSALIGGLFGTGRSFIILGLGVLALIALGPNIPKELDVSNEAWCGMATPYYLSNLVPPVAMGFLLAGLLFADVSTTDQYLLSWSTSIVNDCICPLKKKELSAKQHINTVRITIIVLCGLFFIFGIFYKPTIPLWEYMWLCANIIGGTGIAVMFGMYWKRATTAGAYAAIVVSTILPVADLVARQVCSVMECTYPFRPKITGLYTYLIAAVLLIVISLMSKKRTKYWNLGKVVKEMNQSEEGVQA